MASVEQPDDQPRLPYSTILMVALALVVAYYVPGMFPGWENLSHNQPVLRLPLKPEKAVEIVKLGDADGNGLISVHEAQYLVSMARELPLLEVARSHPEVLEFVGTCSELVGKLMYGRNDTRDEEVRLEQQQEEEDRAYEEEMQRLEEAEDEEEMAERLAREEEARQQATEETAEKEAKKDIIRAKQAAAAAKRSAAQQAVAAKEKAEQQAVAQKRKAEKEATAEKKSKISSVSRLAKHCTDASCGMQPSRIDCAAERYSSALADWAAKTAVSPYSVQLECWGGLAKESSSVSVTAKSVEEHGVIASMPQGSCLSSREALRLLQPLWASPDTSASPKARAATRQEIG